MKNRNLILIAALFTAILLLMISCSEDRTTSSYSSHPNGWNQPGSDEFHGPQSHMTSSHSCAACHGADFLGGESGVSCYTCHAGYPHIGFDGAPAVHANRIAAMDWNLASCQSCHGVDFAGGQANVSCRACHVAAAGPAACNTCHAVPPVDDAGLPQGMAAGSFGAHGKHAVEKGYACTECHAPANGLSHTGPLPAEVTFNYAEIGNRPPSLPYVHLGDNFTGNGTCATYCHSDARGGPPLVDPGQWVGGRLTACQSCHAVPPASDDHPDVPTCHLCHLNVDPASNYNFPDSIRFIDPTTHVNGVVNAIFNP